MVKHEHKVERICDHGEKDYIKQNLDPIWRLPLLTIPHIYHVQRGCEQGEQTVRRCDSSALRPRARRRRDEFGDRVPALAWRGLSVEWVRAYRPEPSVVNEIICLK